MAVREILYRGKNAGGNDWIYGVPLDDEIIRNVEGFVVDVKIKPETVCEFTGLTDKNGVKIFEGDIVEDAELGRRTIIKWLDKYSCFAKTKGELFENINVFADYMEVIGNIFDNPELMGGDKNGQK